MQDGHQHIHPIFRGHHNKYVCIYIYTRVVRTPIKFTCSWYDESVYCAIQIKLCFHAITLQLLMQFNIVITNQTTFIHYKIVVWLDIWIYCIDLIASVQELANNSELIG